MSFRPRHTNDAPYPGSGGSAPRPPETEEELEARQFITACVLDGMTLDEARVLWHEQKKQESS